MRTLLFLLAIGLTTADKLDRTYLPPPGSQYSGGQYGDLQVPLDYASTARPQDTPSSIFPSSTSRPQTILHGFQSSTAIPQGSFTAGTPGTTFYQRPFASSTANPSLNTFSPSTSGLDAQKPYSVPTTTTSYAFSQTTTYSPIEEVDNNEKLPAGNQGQILVDQNGNPLRPNIAQSGAPQHFTGTINQRPVSSIVRYDKNGNNIPQTTYDRNGNIVPQIVYDKEGNIIPQTVYDRNGNIVPQTVYDKNGNIVPQTVYDKKGNIVPQTVYDKNGNIVPQTAYDKNGNIVPQTAYDKNGNIIPQTVYDKSGNIVPQNVYNKNGDMVPQMVYDRYGNIVPQTEYDKNGNIVPQTIYDKNGNTVPQTVYDKNGNIVIPRVIYDSNGNIVPQTAFDKNGNIIPQTVYDKKGNIIPQTVYDRNGNIVPQTVYDKNGNIVPQIVYDRSGSIVPQTVYYKNGNIVPQTIYDKNGNIIPQTVYDSNGNIVPQTVYDKNGNTVSKTFYDKNGNIVPQTTYDRNGNIIPKTVYDKNTQTTYDRNGNIVPQVVYDRNGNVVPQTIYDKNGNIAPQTTYDRNGNIIPLPNYAIDKKPYIRPERPQADADRNAVILNYENVLTPEGFSYSYDTSNGIHADESGTATDGVKAIGAYSYIGDDGKNYSIVYSADENGFRPHGDHLPTPPPIPEAILRVIEDTKRAKEAGVIDDGSYDDNKYGYKKYQGPMDLYHSNRNRLYGPDGKPIRRPIDSSSSNIPGETENYNQENVNIKPSRLPARRPTYQGDNVADNIDDNVNSKNVNDGSQLTVGTQRIPPPRVPGSNLQENVNQDYKIIKNPDGTQTLIPISNDKNTRPGQIYKFEKEQDETNYNYPTSDFVRNDEKSPQTQSETVFGSRRPQLQGVNNNNAPDIFKVNNGQRPNTTYKGYEYLVPVKGFEVSENDKFITQPGGTLNYNQKVTGNRLPINQAIYPSTTIKPGYNVIKGNQGENIFVDEYGRPVTPTKNTFGTATPGTVTQGVPLVTIDGRPIQSGNKGDQMTVTPGYTAETGQTVSLPQNKVDIYGRPVQTPVDQFGRPIVNGPSQNQIAVTPSYTTPDGQIRRVTTPGIKVDGYGRPINPESTQTGFGPQKQITVDEYGRPVTDLGQTGPRKPVTSIVGSDIIPGFTQTGYKPISGQTSPSNQGKVIGEDFTGPQQQPRYDSKTGYYY